MSIARNIGPLIGAQIDVAIAELAARQHGVVAFWQLLALGVGRRAIQHRTARGRLHPLHRGVYAVGHLALTPEAGWMAAVLAAGRGAVLARRSSAAQLGLRPWSGKIELIAPRKRRAPAGTTLSVTALDRDEWELRDGIPATTPARTLFDLAAVLAPQHLERAFHEAEHLRLASPTSIATLLDRHPRRHGARALRALLERDAPQRTRTDMEADFLAFLDARGYPRPLTNVSRVVHGRLIEGDAVFVEQRLIVELDGGSHLTVERFHTDRSRDRSNLADGWRTVRLTARDLHERAGELDADLGRLLPRSQGRVGPHAGAQRDLATPGG